MDQRLVDYLATLGVGPEAIDGWTVHTAQRAGVDCGFVITRGCELHMVSIIGPCAMTRKNIVAHICPLLEEFGMVTTRVPLAETDHKLREALGFVRTWDDGVCSFWMLTRCPYQKNQPEGKPLCQSQS